MKLEFNDPNLHSEAGDILWGQNNKNKAGRRSHYIIYLGPFENNSDCFLGAMLTSSSMDGNIQFKDDHFEVINKETSKPWRVQNKPSYFVAKLFKKFTIWAPFKKVGKLSATGLDIVLNSIGNKTPEEYMGNL